MSTGAVFSLMVNDGVQDKLLMATELLSERLQFIEMQRKNDPSLDDAYPTLLDIEKTHIIFMNAHFKPFVAIGYEYNVVQPIGIPVLGGNITFNIPLFGDFFHDMALHIVLSAPTFNYAEGSAKSTGAWCAYPGMRICSKSSLKINGNPIDEYDNNAYAFHNMFAVQPGKRMAWNRCVGQESPMTAYLNDTTTSYDYTGTFYRTRTAFNVLNGYQTPKPSGYVSNLEMYVPLLFWFCKDVRSAIPSCAIASGQRHINIDFATQNQMFTLFSNGNILGSPAYVRNINITTCELYVNNIFLNPEILRIFVHRVGFYLIRVHKQFTSMCRKEADAVLLSTIRFPVEYMAVGFQMNEIQSNSYGNDRWHLFTDFIDSDDTDNYIGLDTFTLCGINNTSGTGTASATITGSNPRNIVSTLGVNAHGIELYNKYGSMFYDSYMPYTMNGVLNCPYEQGAFLVNFSLYPGAFQPSGHINVSRARELYLHYTSAKKPNGDYIIDETSPALLTVCASCINFLLVSNYSACLRYTT